MTGEALFIWGLALLGIALVLVVIEVFVPSGGVIAALAGISALSGVIMLWRYDTTWGIIAMLTVLVLGPTCLYWGLKMFPYTPMGRALLGGLSEEELETIEQNERDWLMRRKALVGMHGVALNEMHPIGEIEIEGQAYEALAEHAWIDAGSPIVVTHADGMVIKVRPATT